MGDRPAAAPSRDAPRSTVPAPARSAVAVSLFGKTAEAATLVALTLLVPRALGPTDYGTFAVALSVVAIVATSLTLGGPTLLSRFVPASAPDERLPVARALAARLLRLRILQALVVVVAAVVLAIASPGRFADAATAVLVIAIILELGAALAYQICLALGRTTLWSLRYPVQNTVLCCAVLVLYAAAGTTGAIAGIAVAAAAACALGSAVAASSLRGVEPASSPPPGALRFGVLQSIGGLFAQISYRGAAVAAVALGSELEAGYAALASGVALALVYVVWQVFAVDLPSLAAQAAHALEAAETRARRLATMATAVLIPAALSGALLVDWALPLVLGQDFAGAAPAFAPALAVLPLAGVGALVSQLAALRLRPETRVASNAAGALAFVATAVAAVPSWGAPGATAALLAAVVTTTVVGAVSLGESGGARLLVVGLAGSAATLAIGLL